jgi:hypothetical protein
MYSSFVLCVCVFAVSSLCMCVLATALAVHVLQLIAFLCVYVVIA